VYTSGQKVTQTMADLEGAKSNLARLYEHWEEAVELNG
jgi:ATP-binding cassette subfamily F protein 3